MVLVRIAHAADLPTPDEALKLLQSGGGLTSGSRGAVAQPAPSLRDSGSQAGPSSSAGFTATRPASAMPASVPRPLSSGSAGGAQASAQTARQQAQPVVRVGSLEDILALAARNRDIKLQAAIQRDLRLVRIEQGRLDISLEPTGDRGIMQELARKLKDWTGQVWMVTLLQAEGQATLREQKQAQDRERKDSAATHPAVQALMAAFPGAKIVDVRSRMAAESPDMAQGGDETDAGLAASLESGEGLFNSDGDPYPDIEF
jgi:DNA polymerase-3 subunit gamma/tau